jgi:hypothetical protein
MPAEFPRSDGYASPDDGLQVHRRIELRPEDPSDVLRVPLERHLLAMRAVRLAFQRVAPDELMIELHEGAMAQVVC